MRQSLTWTGPTNYYVSYMTTTARGLEEPPESESGVPSKPLSPLPTLPAAQAESDA